MAKLLERIRTMLHDRRHVERTVMVERRKPTTLKEADEHLQEALEKLERTARERRDDFYDRIERK